MAANNWSLSSSSESDDDSDFLFTEMRTDTDFYKRMQKDDWGSDWPEELRSTNRQCNINDESRLNQSLNLNLSNLNVPSTSAQNSSVDIGSVILADSENNTFRLMRILLPTNLETSTNNIQIPQQPAEPRVQKNVQDHVEVPPKDIPLNLIDMIDRPKDPRPRRDDSDARDMEMPVPRFWNESRPRRRRDDNRVSGFKQSLSHIRERVKQKNSDPRLRKGLFNSPKRVTTQSSKDDKLFSAVGLNSSSKMVKLFGTESSDEGEPSGMNESTAFSRERNSTALHAVDSEDQSTDSSIDLNFSQISKKKSDPSPRRTRSSKNKNEKNKKDETNESKIQSKVPPLRLKLSGVKLKDQLTPGTSKKKTEHIDKTEMTKHIERKKPPKFDKSAILEALAVDSTEADAEIVRTEQDPVKEATIETAVETLNNHAMDKVETGNGNVLNDISEKGTNVVNKNEPAVTIELAVTIEPETTSKPTENIDVANEVSPEYGDVLMKDLDEISDAEILKSIEMPGELDDVSMGETFEGLGDISIEEDMCVAAQLVQLNLMDMENDSTDDIHRVLAESRCDVSKEKQSDDKSVDAVADSAAVPDAKVNEPIINHKVVEHENTEQHNKTASSDDIDKKLAEMWGDLSDEKESNEKPNEPILSHQDIIVTLNSSFGPATSAADSPHESAKSTTDKNVDKVPIFELPEIGATEEIFGNDDQVVNEFNDLMSGDFDVGEIENAMNVTESINKFGRAKNLDARDETYRFTIDIRIDDIMAAHSYEPNMVETSDDDQQVDNPLESDNPSCSQWNTEQNVQRHCGICSFKKSRNWKQLVKHYVRKHPGEQIVTSRLANRFKLKDILENPVESINCNMLIKSLCYMCDEYYKLDASKWLQHFIAHTGEYEYKCNKCHSQLFTDLHKCCLSSGNERINGPYEFKENKLYAYVCSQCHYIQLDKQNLLKHLENHHQQLINMETEEKINEILLINWNKSEETNHVIPKKEKRSIDSITNLISEPEVYPIESSSDDDYDDDEVPLAKLTKPVFKNRFKPPTIESKLDTTVDTIDLTSD